MSDSDLIIEPRKGKKEKRLPARALMVVNPSEAAFAFDTFKPFSGDTRTLYQTQFFVDKERTFCVAGPALGAPAAALVLEKLIVLGVKEIWLVSCCGSLDPSHSIGDVLIGTDGVSGEGVTQYYSGNSVVNPSGRVTTQLHTLSRQHDFDTCGGTIWSTDAPYRERRSDLLKLQERYGIVGVDMEFSALCAVASFRGVSLGALFVVSDMLWTRNWKPGFGSSVFKSVSRGLIEKLIFSGLHEESGQ